MTKTVFKLEKYSLRIKVWVRTKNKLKQSIDFDEEICDEGIRVSCKQRGNYDVKMFKENDENSLICESIHDKKNIFNLMSQSHGFEQ